MRGGWRSQSDGRSCRDPNDSVCLHRRQRTSVCAVLDLVEWEDEGLLEPNLFGSIEEYWVNRAFC